MIYRMPLSFDIITVLVCECVALDDCIMEAWDLVSQSSALKFRKFRICSAKTLNIQAQ